MIFSSFSVQARLGQPLNSRLTEGFLLEEARTTLDSPLTKGFLLEEARVKLDSPLTGNKFGEVFLVFQRQANLHFSGPYFTTWTCILSHSKLTLQVPTRRHTVKENKF